MRAGCIAILIVGVSSLLCANACRSDDCALTATCSSAETDAGPSPPANDGGEGEDGGHGYPPVAPPEGCDPTVDPRDAPKCINDEYALFVDSASGDDKNPGTREKPLRTILAATNVDALAGRARIYVTSADQKGSLVLPPGVTLVGGADRATWSPAAGQITKLTTDTAGPLIHTAPPDDGAPREIQITDFDLTPAAGKNLGESSIGIEVISASATFRRVAIHAQNGTNGKVTPTPDNRRMQAGVGHANDNKVGGSSTLCTCKLQGTTTGGAGGDFGKPGNDGVSEPLAEADGTKTSKGGNAYCENGAEGSDGVPGPGGAASGIVGRMTIEGWKPADGAAGANGGPGAGGGGGGGDADRGGGGGGCGGCGGAGGIGGGAGGSSIGIAAFQSELTLSDTTIETKVAGDGEVGGTGQDGELGAPGSELGSCSGGRGGTGAGGSGGAGGAGGISVPVVRFGGSLTKLSAVTLTPGSHGKAGGGGSPGHLFGRAGNTGFGATALTTTYQELELKN